MNDTDCLAPGNQKIFQKILLIEDLAGLREHLRTLLTQNFAVPTDNISEASDGISGVRLAHTLKPDLIIMDISMPQLNGIKAAQQIWAEQPEMKILFWSQYHHEAYVRELAKIVPDEAIHGYALKSEPDDKLLFAISSLLFYGNSYIDPVVRGVHRRAVSRHQGLSDIDYETLLDIALGLTDRAMAARRYISLRGAQSRVNILLAKLLQGEEELMVKDDMEIFNPRTRMVAIALARGLIDLEEICKLNEEMVQWLKQEFLCVPEAALEPASPAVN